MVQCAIHQKKKKTNIVRKKTIKDTNIKAQKKYKIAVYGGVVQSAA